MPHPETAPLVIWVLIATVIVHVALMLLRGWLIAQSRKQCNALEARMKAWEAEQEKRFEDFKNTHSSPWEVIKRKNA